MSKQKLTKEIRLQSESVNVRAEEDGKMIIEGYPIVFDKEARIEWFDGGFYEKVDRHAFDNADMSDVCLKYNHNDDFLIMARTRNGSLTLTPDDKGVFIHAELVDTTQNRDVYKMVQSGLLKEGSFAFTISDDKEEIKDGEIHRTILGVGKLFDVAICPNGAYGDMTEIYARSFEAMEIVKAKREAEASRRCERLRLQISIRTKILGGTK